LPPVWQLVYFKGNSLERILFSGIVVPTRNAGVIPQAGPALEKIEAALDLLYKAGTERALNRHVERVFNPARKGPHWGRRKLARDQ
jgi:hypothetical protein